MRASSTSCGASCASSRGAALRVLQLPDWEVLPYDQFSPLPDLVSERLRTLARLPALQRGILLVTAETLLQRLPPAGYMRCAQLRAGAWASISRSSRCASAWSRPATPASAR